MKNITIIISSLLLTTFFSCKREAIIGEGGIIKHATLFNKSGVSISYIPYYMGRLATEYIVEIAHNDSLLFAKHFAISNGKGPGFLSSYVTGMDSIHIIYDTRYIISHSKIMPDSFLLPHQLSFTHERNLYYIYNYNWWFVEETGNQYHEFTFTAEDYEYAQEYGMKIE